MALSELRALADLQTLCDHASDEAANVREAVGEGLLRIGTRAARKVLRQMVQDEDNEIVRLNLRYMANHGVSPL